MPKCLCLYWLFRCLEAKKSVTLLKSRLAEKVMKSEAGRVGNLGWGTFDIANGISLLSSKDFCAA